MNKKNNRGVLAAAGLLVMLLAGMVYSWSVLSRSIKLEFSDWSSAQLSTVFTLLMVFFCAGIFICGFIGKTVKPRIIVIAGAVFLLAGFVIASKATSLAMLIIGFSVLCGAGSGLSYNGVMSTVTKWFPDKKGFISGLLLMGFGFSGFLVGKLFQAFTPEEIGAWRASFVVMGIATFVLITIGGLFIKAPEADATGGVEEKAEAEKAVVAAEKADAAEKVGGENVTAGGENATAGGENATAGCENVSAGCENAAVKTEYTTMEMLKDARFWLYYVWTISITMAGLALIAQASGAASETVVSLSGGTIATLVGLISIANGGGRIVIGWMYDKIGRAKSMNVINVASLIAAVCLIFALKSGSMVLLVCGFLFMGFAYGGSPVCNAAFISSSFGLKHYAMNFSVISTCLMVGSVGSTISGMIYDSTGSYNVIYLFMIGLTALAIVAGNAIALFERKR